MIQRAFKTRLYPNKAKSILLNKTVGGVRYSYNWAVDQCDKRYKEGQKFDIYAVCRQWTVERPEWAKELPSATMQKGILNAGGAFRNMFNKATHAKHPKHHKKGVNDAFYVNNQDGRVMGDKVKLGKIGYVKMAEPLRYEDAKLNSIVVSKKAGKWYVSVQVEIDEDCRTESDSVVGIDVGCDQWAVSSDGSKLLPPAQLKHLRRELKRKQRLLSRKAKGSHNRYKARIKVAKAYLKISNVKNDAIHKFTAKIAKNHGTVVIESLNIAQMKQGKNKLIRKGVQNSAMGEILRQLKYKCNNFVEISQWYPSTQLCSKCGSKQDMPVSNRTYHCHSCGTTIDRDLNAARNILAEGMRIITEGHSGSACGANLVK